MATTTTSTWTNPKVTTAPADTRSVTVGPVWYTACDHRSCAEKATCYVEVEAVDGIGEYHHLCVPHARRRIAGLGVPDDGLVIIHAPHLVSGAAEL